MADLPRRTLLSAAGLALAAPTLAHAAPGKPRVAMLTKYGTIVVELEAQRAPITSRNFLQYVDAQKYDGASFFRVTHPPGAPADGDIVGAPKLGTHPFPPIPHEPTTKTGLHHVAGTISLGRFQPGTATDNFFICVGPEPAFDAHPGAKGDNLGYAAFGQVVSGMAVVRRIHGLNAHGKSPYKDQQGEWLLHPAIIETMRRVG
ncbi:MAG: peptidylprolyl isomerase [Caulobacteraceae bacterium]|nr:peptidylprolyl isomerase [Caulobacter sp.]